MTANPAIAKMPVDKKEKAAARATEPVNLFHLRRLRPLMAQIRRQAARLPAEADPEALHDFRVSLRRLRSVLATFRRIYHRFYVDAICSELGVITDQTNVHRDQEVMASLVGKLNLSDQGQQDAAARFAVLPAENQNPKCVLFEYLATRPCEQPLKQLKALLILPPRRKETASEVASRVLRRETRRLSEEIRSLPADLSKSKAVHRTRIAAKRLRYIIDYYLPVLPRSARARGRLARKLQSVLGDVHDVDVALASVAEKSDPGQAPQTELIEALNLRRTELAQKAGRILSNAANKLSG